MAVQLTHIASFLDDRENYILVDTRSEGEFAQGHIPGAVNIPVLNNEERKIVGTLYKQQGNQKAVIKGFELAGPRFSEMIAQVLRLAKNKPVMVYCWRGGMRSAIFSWLMDIAGMQVFRIKGGYKQYRRLTFNEVKKSRKIMLLAGITGCGKTQLLHRMANSDFQVLDIEGLAHHKGSVFGAIGQEPQPSVEQFENLMAEVLWKFNPEQPVWVESENQLIGKVIIPNEFKQLMNEAPLVEIIRNQEQRFEIIKAEYGDLPAEELVAATRKLEKRLGNLRMRDAIRAMEENQPEIWIPLLMDYYDSGYRHMLDKIKKNKIATLDISAMKEEDLFNQLSNLETVGNGINRTHHI